MNIKEKAVLYLEKERLLNISILEPIKRETCDILYADSNGVLILEKTLQAYMISTNDINLAKELINNIKKTELFTVHQRELVDIIKDKLGYKNFFEAKQAAYLRNELIDINKQIDIRLLCEKDKDFVKQNYSVIGGTDDYTSCLIDKKHMWGAFDGDKLMGFIGIHSEGSMGLLEVMPEYRKKGIGAALQGYVMNYFIGKGWVPFSQVFTDNAISLKLQKKMGLEISEKSIYWLY